MLLSGGILDVTKGGPIKSFLERPERSPEMIALQIMPREPRLPNYPPSSTIDKKTSRKNRKNETGLSSGV